MTLPQARPHGVWAPQMPMDPVRLTGHPQGFPVGWMRAACPDPWTSLARSANTSGLHSEFLWWVSSSSFRGLGPSWRNLREVQWGAPPRGLLCLILCVEVACFILEIPPCLPPPSLSWNLAVGSEWVGRVGQGCPECSPSSCPCCRGGSSGRARLQMQVSGRCLGRDTAAGWQQRAEHSSLGPLGPPIRS